MPPKSHDSRPPAARGRDPAAKPLTAPTASSAAKAKPQTDKHPKVKSVPPPRAVQLAPRANARSETHASLKASGSSPKLDESSPPDPRPAPAPAVPEPPPQGLDPLQVAAQAYPWMYMTSTLEACFNSSEQAALKIIADQDAEIAQAGGEEGRARVEAERAIEFFEELNSDKFAQKAPAIMKSFHSHGEACATAEGKALELALRPLPDPEDEAPLDVYYDVLDELERLHDQAIELETSITEFATAFESQSEQEPELAARSKVLGVITGCLPVVRARIANLSMAQELVDSAQENVSLSLRMESLGLE